MNSSKQLLQNAMVMTTAQFLGFNCKGDSLGRAMKVAE
jgi:hypothetical protein